MSDSCTIYSPVVDYEGALETVRSVIGKTGAVKVTGKDKWSRIVVTGDKGTLELNSMVQKKPGDEFSRMILGTHNFFKDVRTKAKSNKQRVLDLVLDCNMAIGVVAEPAFVEEEKHFDCVFALARKLQGLVFNGNGMIDEEGRLVLDKQGKFETG